MLIADAPGHRAAAPWLADTDVRTVVLLDADDGTGGADNGDAETWDRIQFDDLGIDTAPPAAKVVGADPVAMIERLGELFKKGILTQAEFDAKKSELLQQIR